MMYIGTSLSGCLLSLLNNEVSEDDVMLIITRTDCPKYEQYVEVVKRYHESDNYVRVNLKGKLSEKPLEDVLRLAERLWYQGKIHQPRSYVSLGGYFSHPFSKYDILWWEVVPTLDNNTPAVVDAYEKYKMLDTLTK